MLTGGGTLKAGAKPVSPQVQIKICYLEKYLFETVMSGTPLNLKLHVVFFPLLFLPGQLEQDLFKVDFP